MAQFHSETHPCPVCGRMVETRRLLSTEGYVAVDLDFRVYARGADPVRLLLVRCPGCAFAEYVTDFRKPVIESVRAAVHAPDYVSLTRSDRASDFPLVAFIKTAKGEPAERVGHAWLRAARFSADLARGSEEEDYMNRAAVCFADALARTSAPLESDEWDRTLYLLAEINRRLGRFAQAAAYVMRVSGSDFSTLVRDQKNLINKGDSRRRRAKAR